MNDKFSEDMEAYCDAVQVNRQAAEIIRLKADINKLRWNYVVVVCVFFLYIVNDILARFYAW